MPEINLPSKEQLDKLIAPKKTQILLNSQSDVLTSNAFNVEGYSSVTFIVTGTFDGEIWFLSKSKDTSGGNFNLPNVLHEETQTFLADGKTTTTGVFHVNIAGQKDIYVRLNKIISGAVTIEAVALKIPNVLIQNKIIESRLQGIETHLKRPRNVELARKLTLTVSAKSYGSLSGENIDVSYYPIQYIAIRANAVHKYRVSFQYYSSPPPIPIIPFPEFFVLDSEGLASNQRMTSAWIEVEGTLMNAYVYNDDTIEHTYDVFLYGVG